MFHTQLKIVVCVCGCQREATLWLLNAFSLAVRNTFSSVIISAIAEISSCGSTKRSVFPPQVAHAISK